MSNLIIQELETTLKKKRVDLLLAYFGGTHSMLQPNYIHFISGYKPISEAVLVLAPGARPQLLLTGSGEIELVATIDDCKEVATGDLAAAISAWMQTVESQACSMVVVGHEELRAELREALPNLTANLVFDNRLVDEFALTRSAETLSYFETGARIAQTGFTAMLNGIEEGKPEFVLAAEMEKMMFAQGAEDNFGMVSASAHNHAVHPPTDRPLRVGDIVLAEISPGYKGCYTQICRSAVLGPVSPAVQKNYDLLIKSFENSLQEIVPGEPLSKACRTMNKVFIDAGYEQYCNPPYMRVRGHSFNFGCASPGNVTIDNHTILQEGMIIVLHPNQYFPDTGYLMFGDTIRVGARGPELLVKADWGLRAL